MKKIIFSNNSTKNMRLIIEPWAEEFLLSPGIIVEIIAAGENTDCLEIDYVDRGVAIHGWSGSALTVMLDGKALAQSPQEYD
jgi:hypothetical protein